MSAGALLAAGHHDVLVAAKTYAGGWARARSLAGIHFARRPSKPEQIWDGVAVTSEILKRHRDSLSLAVTKAPKSLVNAANRLFGSWRSAIEAAELNYDDILLRRSYSDDEVLEWLRNLAITKPRMKPWDLDRYGEHALICRRRWGSYENAARAAGIVGWPQRERSPAMSRAEIVRRLRARAAAMEPVNVQAVKDSPGGHSLINAALHRFATWNDALAAAGVRRARKS